MSTSSGLELLVRLDRQAGQPLHTQLEQVLRTAIRSGRLAVGSRLPSTRALARDLGVTRGLVVECYAQLRAEGYLDTQPGSATVVATPASAGVTEAPTPKQTAEQLRWDLRPGVPDLAGFPRREWTAALRGALRTVPDAALGYGDPRGASLLRQALTAYLGRVRGALTDPEHVVICGGFAQARNLLFRTLHARGARRIALEDPGQPQFRDAAQRAGLESVPIAVDAHGLRVDLLAGADPDVVLVTPAHQFPAGPVLAPDRRRALLDWAQRRGAVIIEDDYDAEFRYDREPVGALQGLAPDRVVYAGSASKVLAPGLRLGWLACPTDLAGELTEAKRAEDLGAPVLDQLALADLLDSGRFDRHLRRVRLRYRARREALVDILGHLAPHLSLSGIAAGMHAVVDLPPGADERHIVDTARQRSVGLYGMSTYRFTQSTQPPALVLGYGATTENAIRQAITRVADLLPQQD